MTFTRRYLPARHAGHVTFKRHVGRYSTWRDVSSDVGRLFDSRDVTLRTTLAARLPIPPYGDTRAFAAQLAKMVDVWTAGGFESSLLGTMP